MKILGIGNAIVDVICKVKNDFLTKNALVKSSMKLVNEVEFKKIQANGNDLIYVSKNAVNVNDSDDEISNKTEVPSDFLQIEEPQNLPIDKTR